MPGDTDPAVLSADELIRLLQAYNNPRKSLGYQTPAELFSNQALHLKRESTFADSSSGGHYENNSAEPAGF